MAYSYGYMWIYYCRQHKNIRSMVMDRKEERQDRFDRKKKFKKVTRSSKVKAERKKTIRKDDDSTVYEYALEH